MATGVFMMAPLICPYLLSRTFDRPLKRAEAPTCGASWLGPSVHSRPSGFVQTDALAEHEAAVNPVSWRDRVSDWHPPVSVRSSPPASAHCTARCHAMSAFLVLGAAVSTSMQRCITSPSAAALRDPRTFGSVFLLSRHK